MPESLLAILLVVYWGLGCYPYHWFFPFTVYENAVEKTSGGGFSFPQPGIAYTGSAPSWVDAAIKDDAFEVELGLQSYDARQAGHGRIFTVSADDYTRNISIDQSDADLVVRLRTVSNSPSEYLVRKLFDDSAPHRIVVCVKEEEIRIQVDGRQSLIAKLPPNALSTWNPGHWLALGNEFTFHRPWRGEIRQATVRVRNTEFDYTALKVRVPGTYDMGMRVFFHELAESVPSSFERPDPRDVAINLVAFVPLGLLLAFVGRPPLSLMAVCISCFLVSLSIEVGQLFLIARVASTSDLLLNTLGGCTGSWIGSRIRRIPSQSRRSLAPRRSNDVRRPTTKESHTQ